MSENLTKLYTEQFTTNLELKLQQMGSKLRGKVREGFHVGKQASPINQIGAIQSQIPSGRFAPLGRVDADFTRRWVMPQFRELPQLIDTFDEVQTIVDPKSQYLQNTANAFGRDQDDAIIASAFGTANIGTDAGSLTSESWSSINPNSEFIVAVDYNSTGVNTGLTVDKLIEAKRILEHYHNDLEADPPTLVIGSKQKSDLLRQVQVVSTEFNERPVLVNGNVTQFMGFNIVTSERLTVSSSQRQVICFVKSGMYLGVWKDMSNNVTQRTDLSSQPWQLYSSHAFGATRLQPGKVLQILCADTTGADITP